MVLFNRGLRRRAHKMTSRFVPSWPVNIIRGVLLGVCSKFDSPFTIWLNFLHREFLYSFLVYHHLNIVFLFHQTNISSSCFENRPDVASSKLRSYGLFRCLRLFCTVSFLQFLFLSYETIGARWCNSKKTLFESKAIRFRKWPAPSRCDGQWAEFSHLQLLCGMSCNSVAWHFKEQLQRVLDLVSLNK